MTLAPITSVALRSAGLASRFLLLLVLARLMSVDEVALFGLMVVAVEFVAFALGLEFYTFSGRQLATNGEAAWPRMLREQLVLHLLVFGVLAVVLTSLAATGWVTPEAVGWFAVLVVADQLSQEAYRLLIAMSLPTAAMLTHFIRTAAWSVPAMMVLWWIPSARQLESIWLFWLVGSLLSLVVPAWQLRHLPWRNALAVGIDWRWIVEGIRRSMIFIGHSLCIRAVLLLDRWLLQMLASLEVVGVYHFFATFARAIGILIEVAVDVHYYPRLVKYWSDGDRQAYRTCLRSFAVSVAKWSLATTAAVTVALWVALPLVGKAELATEAGLFGILAAANLAVCFSDIAYFDLYARRQDKAILVAAISYLGAFAVTAPPLTAAWQASGCATALLAAGLVKLAVTFWLARGPSGP